MLLALGFDVLWLYFVGTSVQLHTHLVVSTSVFLIDRKINLVTKSHGDVWCICFTSSLTDHSQVDFCSLPPLEFHLAADPGGMPRQALAGPGGPRQTPRST